MRCRSRAWVLVPYAFTGLFVALALLSDTPVARLPSSGGCFGFGVSQSVGGISIDARGVLSDMQPGDLKRLREERATALSDMPGDIKQPAALRKISLRKLEAALDAARKSGHALPPEMLCLAGLQNIRYVFIYPEQHDIVLAGFGEGWAVDERGNPVGLSTRRPVLLLDDLLTALRAAERSPGAAITCSIDPTQEGMKRLREYLANVATIGDPQETARAVEQLLGPQMVAIQGVPATSHFARTLLAADYRMKRLGMGFEAAPVPGFPSYLQMIKPGSRGMQNMAPRWWLVPQYDPITTDGEGLSFELRRSSVRCLTEETFLGEGGAKNAPRANPLAQQWADNMTGKYPELALREPIFAQLQNCMDLAIVAALLFKEDAAGKADYRLPLWLDADQLPTEVLAAPRQIDSQANFLKKGRNWVITASGGVEIRPWNVVRKLDSDPKLSEVRQKHLSTTEPANWWWN